MGKFAAAAEPRSAAERARGISAERAIGKCRCTVLNGHAAAIASGGINGERAAGDRVREAVHKQAAAILVGVIALEGSLGNPQHGSPIGIATEHSAAIDRRRVAADHRIRHNDRSSVTEDATAVAPARVE